EPVLKMSVKGPNRKVKAGSKAEFTVKVKNSGQGDATGVRVCLKSSGPVTVQGSRCRTLGKVMAGATQTRHFKVKAKKGKKKSAKISFSLKSSNGDDASASTRLLIRH
ncbi:MAG TPA: CARDB domain-containing protein, partial [Solirubrobacterales bacterium]|nr:CARDB domain-containing protein [Solirubrobacterales bacterium]